MEADRGRRVLIVDDEPVIRELVADFLTDAGYVVETAFDGVDGLRGVQQFGPDLIVLDLMMPVMDAAVFLDHVRAAQRIADIPVVVVSATYAARAAAARLGAQAWLSKPFELDDLLAEVDRLLGGAPARPRAHVRIPAWERSY